MTENTYGLEPWEYDFMVRHLLDNEDIEYYSEKDKEILAEAERKDSTVYMYTKKDDNVTWFSIFTLEDDDNLNEEYLHKMVEKRLESVYKESRDAYGLEYGEDVNAVAGI